MTDPLAYAKALVKEGVPVIVGRPNPSWTPGSSQPEVAFPPGWNTITAEESMDLLVEYRPGVDCLLAVSGWRFDVLDFDSKVAGASDDAIADVKTYGVHRTPSGGTHSFVPCTGLGKRNGVKFDGKDFGDFAGGTESGGGKMLVYLPGSVRPKYPSGVYEVIDPIDMEALKTAEVDDALFGMLLVAGCSPFGTGGAPASSKAELIKFLSEHSVIPLDQCGYGRATVVKILDEFSSAKKLGRHGAAVKSAMRLIELVRAGCAHAGDVTDWETVLATVKPEGGTDGDALLRYAVANADGFVKCHKHGVVKRLPYDQFWMQRDYLQWTHKTAKGAMVSPEALLGSMLIHIASEVTPKLVLPGIVGSTTSLNQFVGLYGPSGAGKSSAFRVAADAHSWAHGGTKTIGSVEGVTGAYVVVEKADPNDPTLSGSRGFSRSH